MSLEQPQEPINEVQHLQLELFRRARFNLLDGEAVVQDLLNWRHLWFSVVSTRLPMPVPDSKSLVSISELALLRTTRWNDRPADTLYIWTDDKRVEQLEKLIEERWQADTVAVLSPEEDIEMRYSNLGHDEENRVLFVWWD